MSKADPVLVPSVLGSRRYGNLVLTMHDTAYYYFLLGLESEKHKDVILSMIFRSHIAVLR